jgi:hypothetical protein
MVRGLGRLPRRAGAPAVSDADASRRETLGCSDRATPRPGGVRGRAASLATPRRRKRTHPATIAGDGSTHQILTNRARTSGTIHGSYGS